MLKENEIYIIDDGHQATIFDIVGINLYNVTHTGAEIIKDFFFKKKDIKKIAQEHKIEKEKIMGFISKIEEIIEEKRRNLRPSGYAPNAISRLNINVSHKCNFACKYCYANHGTYGGSASIMSIHTAIQTVKFFCEKFDRIDSVVFFGGEPLLNMPAIEIIIKNFHSFCKSRRMRLPQFVVLTNGSIYTEKIATVLDKYNVALSISIDGPSQIHDKIRRYKKNGRGTLKTILSNIERYKKFSNIALWYEATYTPFHKRKKMDRAQTKYFIENNTGIKKGTISDAFLPQKHIDEMKYYCFTLDEIFSDFKYIGKIVESSLNNILKGKSFNWDIGKMISYFVERQPSHLFCTAGLQTYIVTPDGNIYPCQFFIDERFKLGSVFEGFNEGKLAEFSFFINKATNPKCKDCWLRFVCETCMGQFYQMTGEFAIPEMYCKFKKKLWEIFLMKINKIFSDANKREKFISNFNRLSKGGIAK